MSVDKAELCDSLLVWLQMFQVPSCTSKRDLTNGVAIAHVLHKIDPSWFNETWLGRIKEESGDNWRLKVSNLKKILQSMMEYYHDVLGQQVEDEHVPDVSLIGEMGDVVELGRLVQLVLGCAVSCEKKHEHIQQIMTLEESVQHVVMTAIQELLSKETVESGSPDTYGDFDYQSRKYYFLSEELDEKDDVSQRCRELEQQLSVLMEEKSTMQTELQSLKDRLSRCEPQDASTTITGKKLLLLQTQLEQLQEENYRLENSRDDLRIRSEALEREVADLQHRNEELTSLAQEAQTLKDEMDILRHSSDRVSRLEALVETYKRKLEDLGDLRRQVRLLEERNTVYMQRTCELEEELRRANAGRTQLDSYKRQVHELHTKHSSEAMKAEKWQFEYKNLNDKYEALLKEKERLISERDTLRETNEELRCAQVQQKCLSQAGSLVSDSGAVGNLASEIMPTEFKETVVRLQSENKMLCAQEESYRQRLGVVQAQLEEAQRSQNTLETQNRLSQQQIAQLRSQVEDLQKALQEQDSKAEDAISSLLQKKLEEHLEKLHEAHSDLQKKREVIDDLEPGADSNMAKKIDELQEILKKKDEDMKQMEERYKRYVEKARTVIKTLDPKQKPHSLPPEVQALRNQLSERDRKIQHMEHDFEKTRSRHDQEEKLIISAWYNMGMALHQKVVGERTGSPGQAQSFLAQQRQSTQARRGLTARFQPR
ncbi:protein Hook homolog 2-like isoform X1 [Colossoma macropomum]|uniref:protein Hook homolog 2-like isoform X1 n=1 Tax=Colossoma macropomum TaxID=42526 RepID=UPI001863D52D|nr:protein Hook homolog 2-like isoform X1 [Colossoma macropomum]